MVAGPPRVVQKAQSRYSLVCPRFRGGVEREEVQNYASFVSRGDLFVSRYVDG